MCSLFYFILFCILGSEVPFFFEEGSGVESLEKGFQKDNGSGNYLKCIVPSEIL